MFNWLIKLFRKKQVEPKKVTPEMVRDDNEILREMVARVWNTGKTTVAEVDEKGKVTFSD